LNIFKSAFEKLTVESQLQIANSTQVTAIAVSPGGILFGKIEEMVKLLKQIAVNTQKSGKNEGPGVAGVIALKILGGRALEGIGKGLQSIINAIDTIQGTGKEFKEKAGALILTIDSLSKIGPSILKFAGYLFLATPLLIVGAIAAPLFGLSLFIITKTLQMASGPLSNKKTQKTLSELGFIGASILTFGISLVLSSFIYPVGVMALPYIAISLLTIGGIFFLLNKLNIEKSIRSVSIGLIFAAGAILSLGVTFLLFDMILSEIQDPTTTLLMIAGLVTGVALVMFIAGKFSKEIFKGSVVMAIASIPIILLAISALMFSSAITPDESGWITIGQIGALVTGVGLVMGVAGAAAPFILAGAAAMVVAGLALIIISFGAAAMSKLFNNNDMTKMLGDSGYETEGFMGFGGGRMMSNMEWLMLSIARSFTLNPLSIASMYATVPVMILAGAALSIVARGIKKIQELKIDYNILPDQIGKLVTVLAGAFGSIGEQFPGGSKSVFSRIFGGGTQSPVADGIDAVLGMGNALSSIAQGVQAMAELKFPIYEGTKITGYYTLKNDTFATVTDNIKLMVNSLSSAFGEIGLKYPGGQRSFTQMIFGGGGNPVTDGIGAVQGIGSAVAEIAKGIQGFANLKIPIYKDGKIIGYESMDSGAMTKVSDNIRSMVVSLTGTMGEIGNNPDAQNDWGWFGSSKIEDGVKIVTSFADPLYKIANAAKNFMAINVDPIALSTKIQNIIKGMTNALSSVGEDNEKQENFVVILGNVGKKLEDIGKNIDPWVKFVDNFKKYVDDMGRLKDTLNAFDKVNLKFTSDMFQGLAYLSGYKGAGSINQMSTALNESIRMLAEMIDEFKNKVTGSPTVNENQQTVSNVPQNTTQNQITMIPDAQGSKTGITIQQLESMLQRITLKVDDGGMF